MGFLSATKQYIIGLATNFTTSWNTINVPRSDDAVKNNIIINKLSVQPVIRQTQDVQKWRNALIMAEGMTQQRSILFDLYDDCLLDGYLDNALDKRRCQITNLEFVFTDAEGKPNDDINTLINTTYFEELLKEIINAKFYGHSLVQLDWSRTEGYANTTTLIPRKHVKPRFGIVVKNTWDTEGINYLETPFTNDVIEIGGKEDLGKLLKVCPLVIYKRGDWGDWSEFCESFGMPIIDAAYNNEGTRDQLQQAFAQMGARGRLIRPADAIIDVKTINDNGTAGDLYDTFRKALNEEISITILGNSMTTTEAKNSGYAQSKTHADSQEQLHKDDRKSTLRILNEKVKPYLHRIGFNTEGGSFKIVDAETLTLTERLGIDIKVAEKVDIGKSYWYTKYNIPMPTAAEVAEIEEEEAAADEAAQPDEAAPTDDAKAKKKKR
jgi:phage gp29-like protein